MAAGIRFARHWERARGIVSGANACVRPATAQIERDQLRSALVNVMLTPVSDNGWRTQDYLNGLLQRASASPKVIRFGFNNELRRTFF